MLRFSIFLFSLLNFNIHATTNEWNFEINKEEYTNNYSSYVFSNNYENSFSIYCDDAQRDLYFLMQINKENFQEEINYVTVYFDNDRTIEYKLAVDYSKDSLFFNKSSFFIGYNNHYDFYNFFNDIRRKNTITFLTRFNGIEVYNFSLKNSFNSTNTLKTNCGI